VPTSEVTPTLEFRSVLTLNPNSEVRGAVGGAMLGCTRRWRSQRLYPIDTVQDRPAACAANDGGECGASNFGVRAQLYLPSIVVGELYYGAYHTPHSDKQLARVRSFLPLAQTVLIPNSEVRCA
jgi:hypothetical protein